MILRAILPLLAPIAFLALTWTGAQNLQAQASISNLSASTDPDNALHHTFQFSTSTPTRAYVRYAYAHGLDSIWLHTAVSPLGTQHSLPAVGFVPQQDYVWQAIAFDTTAFVSSPYQALSVGIAPANLPTLDTLWASPGSTLPGYILAASHPAQPLRSLQLWDRFGQLIWYDSLPGTSDPAADGLCQAYNFAQDRLLLIDCDSIHERSLDGSYQRITTPQFADPDVLMHHEIFGRDGAYKALVAIPEQVIRISPPNDTDLVIGDGIVSVDDLGQVIYLASYHEALSPQDAPAPGGYWTPRFGPDAVDWKGVRSIMLDFDGYWMLANSRSDQVTKFEFWDQLAWTCGVDGMIRVLPPDSFFTPTGLRSSAPYFYLTYDHGTDGNANRAMEWWIDWGYTVPEMLVSWEFEIPAAFASPDEGHIEALPSGNFLVSSGQGGGIWEVRPDGGVAWFAGAAADLDRALWVPRLYELPELAYLGETQLCATDSLVYLQGSPAGGLWTGPYVGSGYFDAAAANSGSHVLHYRYGADSIAVTVQVDNSSGCATALQSGASALPEFSIYPNPYRESIRINYSLPQKAQVWIDFYSADGRWLGQAFSGQQSPGMQDWELRPPAHTGPLYLRLRTSTGHHAGKWLFQLPD